MADSDSFIDEVKTEVRRDRFFHLLRRYGWIGVVVLLVIIGGAGIYEWYKAQHKKQTEALGSIIETIQTTPSAVTQDTIARLFQQQNKANTPLVYLTLAHQQITDNNASAAYATLDTLIDNPDVSIVYDHLARLQQTMLDVAENTPEARATAFAVLTAPNAPYRSLALEQQALDLIKDGKQSDAVPILRALVDAANTPINLRMRARQILLVLDASL